jgi:hypothetical protein
MKELMRRFVEEADRGQWMLLRECLDDLIGESNPVRVIDVFVDAPGHNDRRTAPAARRWIPIRPVRR